MGRVKFDSSHVFYISLLLLILNLVTCNLLFRWYLKEIKTQILFCLWIFLCFVCQIIRKFHKEYKIKFIDFYKICFLYLRISVLNVELIYIL